MIQIEYAAFKKAIKVASKFCSKDEARPCMTYIKAEFSAPRGGGILKLTASDGYRAVIITIPARVENVSEQPFVTVIHPKQLLLGRFDIVKVSRGKLIYRNLFFGEVSMALKTSMDYTVEIEKVYESNKFEGGAAKIGFNPRFFADIASEFNDLFRFYIPKDGASPMRILTDYHGARFDFLLLPVRVSNWNNL